jgi:hypothetical protein
LQVSRGVHRQRPPQCLSDTLEMLDCLATDKSAIARFRNCGGCRDLLDMYRVHASAFPAGLFERLAGEVARTEFWGNGVSAANEAVRFELASAAYEACSSHILSMNETPVVVGGYVGSNETAVAIKCASGCAVPSTTEVIPLLGCPTGHIMWNKFMLTWQIAETRILDTINCTMGPAFRAVTARPWLITHAQTLSTVMDIAKIDGPGIGLLVVLFDENGAIRVVDAAGNTVSSVGLTWDRTDRRSSREEGASVSYPWLAWCFTQGLSVVASGNA